MNLQEEMDRLDKKCDELLKNKKIRKLYNQVVISEIQFDDNKLKKYQPEIDEINHKCKSLMQKKSIVKAYRKFTRK